MNVKNLASFIKRTESASYKKLVAMKERTNTQDSKRIIVLNQEMLKSNEEMQSISNDILQIPVGDFIDQMSNLDNEQTKKITDQLTRFSNSLNCLSSKIIEVKKTFEIDELEKKMDNLSIEIDVFKIESRHLLDIDMDAEHNCGM